MKEERKKGRENEWEENGRKKWMRWESMEDKICLRGEKNEEEKEQRDKEIKMRKSDVRKENENEWWEKERKYKWEKKV